MFQKHVCIKHFCACEQPRELLTMTELSINSVKWGGEESRNMNEVCVVWRTCELICSSLWCILIKPL